MSAKKQFSFSLLSFNPDNSRFKQWDFVLGASDVSNPPQVVVDVPRNLLDGEYLTPAALAYIGKVFHDAIDEVLEREETE
ncbi:MAG: hypothetical protein ACOY58_04525 [Candidatus Micrarchaeota archaeon]